MITFSSVAVSAITNGRSHSKLTDSVSSRHFEELSTVCIQFFFFSVGNAAKSGLGESAMKKKEDRRGDLILI